MEYDGEYGSSVGRTHGDGDGTVNMRSLRGCKDWENSVEQNGHPVYHHFYKYAEHYDILKDPRAINYVLKQALGNDNFVIPDFNRTKNANFLDALKDFKFKFL